jgi:uncharacterized protein
MLRALVILALAVFAIAAQPAQAAPTFPPLNGQRVVDDAHVLSAATVADLTAKSAALEQKTGDQLVVVTLPDLQGYEIEDYGYQLGRYWALGQKGKDNGLIFIVVPSAHKVRVEVGYGLEPVMTDALSSQILQEQVLPKFRAGDVDGGVTAGTDALIAQLGLDPAQAQANNVRAAAQPPPYHRPNPIPIIIILVVFFFVIRGLFGLRRGGLWMAAPFLFSGGGGGFGGGGFGGGGGGGFSGGGGSFGGGGASGSW